MKKQIIIAVFSILFLLPFGVSAQGQLRKFINNISNEKLHFEIAKVGTTKILDSNRIELPKLQVFVSSPDVETLLVHVNKKKVIKSLIKLLKDGNKDWSANVLLYQLTGRDAVLLASAENREDWFKRSRDNDLLYWREFARNH